MKIPKGVFVVFSCIFLLFTIAMGQSLAACEGQDVPLVDILEDPGSDAYDRSSIQSAYDYASFQSGGSGLSQFTLQLVGGTFDENLTLNGGEVTFDGGYDCGTDFSSKSGIPTSLLGQLIIADGVVKVGDEFRIVGMPTCAFDIDGDGYTSIGSCEGSADDCDDNDPNTYPGADEICDGLDNNCNGVADEGLVAVDEDGDGYFADESCGSDCNDDNPLINPGAVEIFGDGIDQNCDGYDLLSGTIDNQCFNCHSTYFVNNLRHLYTAAPDGSCVDCHADEVNTLLPGHYGRTVHSAGNNMSVGETISCTSCHDYHTEDNLVLSDNVVWGKVVAEFASGGTLTCDTCHEDRAAAHDAAHDNRVITTVCASCHTSDTSIVGQPGTGTLVSQSDVDAVHNGNCILCHGYTGTSISQIVVEQAIQAGINGTEINCLTCHYNFEDVHAFLDNHNDLVQVGSTSCGNCHTDPPPLVDPADPKMHSACSNCHDANYNTISLAEGKTFAVGGNCTTCHIAPFDTVHPADLDHSALVKVETTSCGNCHNDPPPLVDSVDPKVHNACSSCHDAQGGLIGSAVGQSFAIPGNCTTCHTAPFATVHPEDVDHSALVTVADRESIGDTISCGNCHSDPPPLVDPVDPKVHNECSSCHDLQGGLIGGPLGSAVGQSFAILGNCKTCHTDTFVNLHPIDTDHSQAIQLSTDCDGCHSAPPPVIDPVEPKIHSACANCHDDEGALVSLAVGNEAPNDCIECHGNDLGTLHPDTGTTHLASPGSGDVLVFASGHHDSAMQGDGVVYTDCNLCHTTNLGDIHDDNCATCHSGSPSPYDTLGGFWAGGCQQGGCHTEYHADATVSHWAVEDDCNQCHVQPSNEVPDTSCANCHATDYVGDTEAPVTISDVQPSYVVPALINYTITDNGGKVGIGTTYSRLNGGQPEVGTSLLVDTAGSYTLEFWTVDQAGNEEMPHKTASFNVAGDTLPPVTTSNAQANYYSTAANITLSATDDNHAGIIDTYYSLDGGSVQTGNLVYVPEQNGTVAHSLEFWSVDPSGNEELPHNTVNFTIHGGTGTLRLIWGTSDIDGSPCGNYPTAAANWTIRSGGQSGSFVASGSNACPGWSGVDDVVVDVSPTSYHVSIDWYDPDEEFYENTIYPAVDITVHGEVEELRY